MPTPRFVKRFLFLYCFLIYYDPIIGCALQKRLKRAKNTCFIAECFLSEKGGTPCPPLTENHFARKNNLAELGGSPNVVDKFTSKLWSWVLVRIWNLKRNMIWNAIKDNLSLKHISLLFYFNLFLFYNKNHPSLLSKDQTQHNHRIYTIII